MSVRDHLTALDRETWLRVRQGYLQVVDAVERRFGIEPRTAVCREIVKQQLRAGVLELPQEGQSRSESLAKKKFS